MTRITIEGASQQEVLAFVHPENWRGNVPGVPNEDTPMLVRVLPTGTWGKIIMATIKRGLVGRSAAPQNFCVNATFVPNEHTLFTEFDARNHTTGTYLAIDHELVTIDPDRPFSRDDFGGVIPAVRRDVRLGEHVVKVGQEIAYGHAVSLGQVVTVPVADHYTLVIAHADMQVNRAGQPIPAVSFLPPDLHIGEVYQEGHYLSRINRIDILGTIPSPPPN